MPGSGEFDGYGLPRGGEFDLAWVGWGKLNQKCQVLNRFFGGAPKSLTAINTCLDEMEEFKGRDSALQKKLSKKGLKVRVLKY